MKPKMALILLLLLTRSTAAAEAPALPLPDGPAASELASSQDVKPRRDTFRGADVTYDPQTDTIAHISAVRDDGERVDGAATPRQAADAFLRLHADEFGFSPTLDALSAPRVFGAEHFHAQYDQMFGGLPVFDGMVDVVVDAEDNSITGIHANLVPITGSIESWQFVSAETATQAAVKVFGGHVNEVERGHMPSGPTPRLGLLVDGGRPLPAWQIPLVTRSGNWWVVVDATSLQILAAEPGPPIA